MLQKTFSYKTVDKTAKCFFISAHKTKVFIELQFPASVFLQSIIFVQKKN